MEIQELKPFLPDYLEMIGVDVIKAERNNAPCPVCGNGYNTGCFHFFRKNMKVNCFRCGFNGDLIDLIQETEKTDKNGACIIARKLFANNNNNNTPIKEKSAGSVLEAQTTEKTNDDLIQRCHAVVSETDYFTRRGLSDEIIKQYRLGYEKEHENAVIPYPGESYYFKRGIKSDFKGKSRGKEPLFNLFDLYNNQIAPVFVTEGQIDALSFKECGACAVALGSAENTGKLLKALQERRTESRIIIATDADEAGQKAADKLKEGLEGLCIQCERMEMAEGCKDPNEYLVKDRLGFQQAIKSFERRSDAGSWKQRSASGYLETFFREVQTIQPIKSGFDPLDNALGGGFLPGLAFIGASPSMGKTTFVIQMIENIVQRQNKSALIFSLETSKRELIAKDFSRLLFERSKEEGYTQSDFLRGFEWDEKTKAAALKAAAIYQEYADRLYIVDDAGTAIEDILECAKEYIRESGTVPVICIDYLQLLTSKSNKADDVQGTIKTAVHLLKNFTREYNTIVFVVTAFGRSSAGQKATLESGRDTSNIEYSADYFISLQFTDIENGNTGSDVDTLKEKPCREITAKILKNKIGITGTKLQANYHARYNYFEFGNPPQIRQRKVK